MLNDLTAHIANTSGLGAPASKKALGIVLNAAERQDSPFAAAMFKAIPATRKLSTRTGKDAGAPTGEIARLIEQIREKMSLVYSLNAGNRPSVAYDDAGTFGTMAPCEPSKAAQVVTEIKKIYDAFAKDGPTDEELANAKKQIANNLDEEMREPSHWLRVLRDLDYHARSLEDEKQEPTAYEKYSPDDVKKVFLKYYKPERTFEITAGPAPEKPAEGGAAPAEQKS